MGKHWLFYQKKHYWHLSHKKARNLNRLFYLIDREHEACQGFGRYADKVKILKERRETDAETANQARLDL